MLGECKWTIRPVGVDILRELERKSRLVQELERYPLYLCSLLAGWFHAPAR